VDAALAPADLNTYVPFVLHAGFDGWQGTLDLPSTHLGLGMHGARLEPAMLRGCRVINFTRYYPLAQRWEGVDHTVHLDGPEGAGEPDEDEA
jgi:hypothetical protein